MTNTYVVVDDTLTFTVGSNTQRPSGTHTIRPTFGQLIERESIASDGTTWWMVDGQRVKYTGNGMCPKLTKGLLG